MTRRPELLVFSDLDGTLLDHRSYSWAPAAPALARLRAMGAGVVLATSKTAAEVAPLRDEIGFSDWPAIVENGGGILAPGDVAGADRAIYDHIRALIAGLPAGFTGFGDMTVDDVSASTGLSHQDASRAKARQFSEPGLWTGTDAGYAAFAEAAGQAGLCIQRGGRFLALSFGGTKADRVTELAGKFAPKQTVALGDAPNDIGMLEAADLGIVVANGSAPDLPPLAGEDVGCIRRTVGEGSQGWAEAMLQVLDELSQSGADIHHG
ncbi:MAG: HAD hydrolase family protein [Marinibacterium sp.]|nr:HAD hydrolase family protein [Marinibacterium sp.]